MLILLRAREEGVLILLRARKEGRGGEGQQERKGGGGAQERKGGYAHIVVSIYVCTHGHGQAHEDAHIHKQRKLGACFINLLADLLLVLRPCVVLKAQSLRHP